MYSLIGCFLQEGDDGGGAKLYLLGLKGNRLG